MHTLLAFGVLHFGFEPAGSFSRQSVGIRLLMMALSTKVQTVSNSIFTFLPSAVAALTKVVKVKLVSSSSNNRLSEALLVCIFFAIAVLLGLRADMPSDNCQAMTSYECLLHGV